MSHVQLFVTPWTAARQASLPFTISWSLLKLTSIESVMPTNHLILCRSLLLPSIFPRIRVFSKPLHTVPLTLFFNCLLYHMLGHAFNGFYSCCRIRLASESQMRPRAPGPPGSPYTLCERWSMTKNVRAFPSSFIFILSLCLYLSIHTSPPLFPSLSYVYLHTIYLSISI